MDSPDVSRVNLIQVSSLNEILPKDCNYLGGNSKCSLEAFAASGTTSTIGTNEYCGKVFEFLC